MKKPTYKRELSHSYLVVDDLPERGMNQYQYRMILRNRIPGLLTSSERHMEGRTCLYYDISSRQSLAQMYLSASLSFQSIRGMIDNMAQVQDTMAEYLLEEEGLILEPEYIYMDLETEQLFFLYYPFTGQQPAARNIYLPVAEFLLEHVDHKEERAVNAAYQFYKMSKAESFTIGSFRTYLERESQTGEAGTGACRTKEAGRRAGEDIRRAEDGARRAEEAVYGAAEYGRGMGAGILLTDQEGVYEFQRNAGQIHRGSTEYTNEYVCSDTLDEEAAEKTYETKTRGTDQCKGKDETRRGRERIGSIIGLTLSSVLFVLVCALIWYMKPAGNQKIFLFAVLAADGFALLIFLWLATAVRQPQEEEETAGQDREDTPPFWEGYTAGTEDDEINGTTVYFGDMPPKEQEGRRSPRLTGSPEGKYLEYSLERLPVTVGKLKSRVQLLLSHATVSRIHARFIEKDGRTALMDMNSTNGTYINGIRLEQEEIVILEPEDEVSFGDVKMKYSE